LENWIKVIEKYRPDIFIEMGTAHGGNAIYINDLISKLGNTPIIYGIDIEDNLHPKTREIENFTFIKDSTTSLGAVDSIKKLVQSNPDKRILIHLDDNHISSHVKSELEIYSKIIKSGDVIIVGDTWDEGWYDSPFNALCDFTENDNTMFIDSDLNREMIMPCNWIFGILVKK
jgi:cephalosporin hydroxylase